MKVIYPLAYYAPERTASSILIENRLQAYAEAGFIIEAFTPTPCRGVSSEERSLYKSQRFRREEKYNGRLVFPIC